LAPEDARELIKLARSSDAQDIDELIEIGMTRGMRHPRLAVQAIGAEVAQRMAREQFALSEQMGRDQLALSEQMGREQLALAQQTIKLSRMLLAATFLAALAAFLQVLALVPK
jgi:hypothetical protein